MKKQEILAHIDHTQLKPFCTWEDIRTLCEEALEYQTASVCVPPSYIDRIKFTYGDKINICTVIGFPNGYNTTAVKEAEIKDALARGCNEVDMVINIGDVKNGDFDLVEQEIRTLKAATGNHILKVIVETCFLTEEEKIKLCQCVTNAGADYIKTSTGFGTGGATIEDIQLFAKHIGPAVKMKAAGGVKSREDLEMFLAAGCSRIGTSSAVKMLENEE